MNPARSALRALAAIVPLALLAGSPGAAGAFAEGDTATDSTRPVVSIVNPTKGAVVSLPFKVQARIFSPGDRPVTVASLLVDGASDAMAPSAQYGTTASAGMWEYQVDTLASGEHGLQVWAENATGGVYSAAVLVTVRASGRGDGNLLVRDNASQLCSDCHSMPSHSSETTGARKGSWATTCRDCHTPHGTRNIALIAEQVTPPALEGPQTPKAVVFHRKEAYGPGSYANADGTGPCQVCHTRTAFFRADGSGADHNPTSNCGECHQHGRGFAMTCTDCHGSPPAVGKHLSHDETAFAESAYANGARHASATQYGFACATCHDGQHMDGAASPYTVQVSFGILGSQPVGGAYAAGAAQPPDPGSSGRLYAWSDGTCAATYCHSNAAPVLGTDAPASPTWNETAWVKGGPSADQCVKCHAMSADDPWSPASTNLSRAHRVHTTTYAYDCASCHAGVATGRSTYPADAASIGDKTRHVNGTKDVAFAGLDAGALPYGSGGPYTCSNTYCHSDGVDRTPPFTSGPSVPWTLTAGCGACHAAGPAMATGSHGLHVANAYVGTSVGCARCHDTVSADDTIAAGKRGQHVNGAVEVPGTGYSDGTANGVADGTCAATYCHSNGTETLDAGDYRPVAWGGADGDDDCDECHGRESSPAFVSVYGEPNYATDRWAPNGDRRNSHDEHLSATPEAAKTECVNCHAGTVDPFGALVPGGQHLDGVRNVSGPGFGSYDEAIEGCGTVSCHGGGDAIWGEPP
jgi:predicted CxxxxCH...CXXCH cytochrome family protein